MNTNKDLVEPPFLWGVTHIAPQVEASCLSSDWYYAACNGQVPEIGHGVAYLEDYAAHHDHLEDLGCNAFRLSLEWARIEPEEGVLDAVALDRYRAVLQDLRTRNIKTVVGLFHWSLPQWFAHSYGLHHKEAPEKFETYARNVRESLGDLIDILVILNEPMVYVGTSYLLGQRPPFRKNVFLAYRALTNLVDIHIQTYSLWKEAYPHTLIGSAHLYNDIRAKKEDRFFLRILLAFGEKISAYFRVHYILGKTRESSDYIGLNYYLKNSFFFGRKGGKWGLHTTNNWHDPDVWHHYVDGFASSLKAAAKYDLPLYVMENGKPSDAGEDDADRQRFLAEHVAVLLRTREIWRIRGYFHHCFMDCYEWDSGYDFKFGLIEVDRDTLELRPRKSYTTYKKLIDTSS